MERVQVPVPRKVRLGWWLRPVIWHWLVEFLEYVQLFLLLLVVLLLPLLLLLMLIA